MIGYVPDPTNPDRVAQVMLGVRSAGGGIRFAGVARLDPSVKDGEALRHDDQFAYVAAWEFAGDDGTGRMGPPILHKEDLVYTAIEMKQRSYK